MRWRQKDHAPNTDPNMVELNIPQTITAELYHRKCVQIDRNNRFCQESLDIEIILSTKEWSKRFNLFVFKINVEDVWLAYQVIIRMAETQSDFYKYLSEKMIDITYNRFMMQSADGRTRKIVDSDDKTFDENNPTVWTDQCCSHMLNLSTCDPN